MHLPMSTNFRQPEISKDYKNLKNKFTSGSLTVDQAIKTLSEVWHIQDILLRRLNPGLGNSSMIFKLQTTRKIPKQHLNFKLNFQ